MTEIKMENGKSNVCRNGDFGVCHKIPDQVGDDRKVKCSGMTERSRGERGRSMVEMLGVLAVAGVLSIGGVAGYRWAMDKYRANDTIRELSQRAVVHSQQMLAGNTVLSNAEFNPANQTRLGYGLTQAILAAQPDFFEIRLSDVPERVCQNIIDSDWVLPSGWEINGSSEDGVMCATTNSMAFFFHRVLDNTKVANGEETTVTDSITTSTPTPETTYTDYETTYTDYETTYTDYETTYTETVSYGEICDKYGRCYDCSYFTSDKILVNSASACSQCDNTGYKWVATYSQDEYDNPGCSPCSGTWMSDTEDRIEALCAQCNRGVDWGSYGADAYHCSSTSEDIGTKPSETSGAEITTGGSTTTTETTSVVTTTTGVTTTQPETTG